MPPKDLLQVVPRCFEAADFLKAAPSEGTLSVRLLFTSSERLQKW